jgi:ABC-2 type transport system ATP-binding protein
MIDVEGLYKTFEGKTALGGFSLHIAEGELFGLVGPNGAGKTTLIKILATLLTPTSGSARIGGYDVRSSPEQVKRVVGYMPDQPGLYQDMRLREFLQFFADAFHIPRNEQKTAIAQALERSGLTDRQQAFVEELSFGLKQRLFLAKTLLHKPKVLLLDEPATGLDPIARLNLRQQLKELNAQGVTILISSHILSDLEDICSRVALISNGKSTVDGEGNSIIQLRRTGTATDVYEVEFLGAVETAVKAIESASGGKVVQAQGSRLLIEIPGGKAEAAAVLKQLMTSGVEVFKFDRHASALEESYQQAFGVKRP